MRKDGIVKLLTRESPWGTLFAERRNYEYGYFVEEGRLVERYLIKKNQSILVIGSGNGREAHPICHDGHRIVCIDIGLLYLVVGRRLFATENIESVTFVQADMRCLPFVQDAFDFIFFSLYCWASESRFAVLRGLHHLLHRNGTVLLTTVTPRYEVLTPHVDAEKRIIFSDIEELEKEVSSCGFDLLESAVDAERSEYRFSMLRARVM